MSELKKCPFCGSEAKRHSVVDQVLCTCKAITGSPYDSDCPTVEIWNTRPIEDALTQRIAELEESLRWRDVSELPEKENAYEMEFMRTNGSYFYEILRFSADTLIDIEKRNASCVIRWRPIPELDTKGGER